MATTDGSVWSMLIKKLLFQCYIVEHIRKCSGNLNVISRKDQTLIGREKIRNRKRLLWNPLNIVGCWLEYLTRQFHRSRHNRMVGQHWKIDVTCTCVDRWVIIDYNNVCAMNQLDCLISSTSYVMDKTHNFRKNKNKKKNKKNKEKLDWILQAKQYISTDIWIWPLRVIRGQKYFHHSKAHTWHPI